MEIGFPTVAGKLQDFMISYVLFIFIGNIGIKPFTNAIIRKLGYRSALLSSFGMVFITSVALAFIHANTFPVYIMFLALISGAGRSLALTNYSGLSFSEIAPQIEIVRIL